MTEHCDARIAARTDARTVAPLPGSSRPVPLSDARVASIGVLECGEPLVDIRRFHRLTVDDRDPDASPVRALVRVGVLDRLLRAADALPSGVHLVLLEGYRPTPVQRRVFERQLEVLRTALPQLDDDELHQEAGAHVAPPAVAPHCAGAAVDVALEDASGARLPMGSEVNTAPPRGGSIHGTDAPGTDPDALRHRAMLRAAMEQAGFVNYPAEWWHYSYGDRYWAYSTGRAAAKYGPVGDPWDSP